MGAVGVSVRRVLGVAALAVGVLGFAAPAAHAVEVSCGQTISQDTKVSNDLKDCPGDGLVVDTAGVVLDLNGHTIDGDASGNDTGILISNVDDVTVKSGKVRQFSAGVFLGSSQGGHRLLSLKALDNTNDGVLFGTVANSVVRNVQASDNGDSGFSALFTITGLIFQRTTASGSEGPGYVLRLRNGLIEHSKASHNGGDGLRLFFASGNLVRDFVAENNDLGGLVLPSSFANTFLRIRAVNNGDSGVLVQGGDNKLLSSLASRNAEDGVSVASGATGTLLSGNTANDNGADGIGVSDDATTLRRNTANDNDEDGIDATAGVTDLGGNRAKGNGAQNCVNVNC
jgi:parallel beta-helix repeat protein